MEYLTADVKAIAEVLRWNKDKGYYTTVLVGAGMSVSAGIPPALGMMTEIEKQFTCAAANCPDKTYPAYMAALSPVERRELIGSFVDKAKINLAHLYLSSLVQAGYVDHLLTTNFDPLIVRSLALFNIYPAIYDFAASQAFIPGEAAQRSVFHLHGQRDGFILLNTKDEVDGLYKNLGDLFFDTNRKRSWIVIGYSGENDPVFKRLAEIEVFQHRMYWVGYMDKEPPQHVLEKILSPAAKRYAFYVKGYDADSFFVALARELKFEDPPIVRRPFTYLGEVINNIVDKCCIDGRETDIMAEARKFVAEASHGFEERQGFPTQKAMNIEEIKRDDLVRRARDIWVHGKYDELEAIADDPRSKDIPEVGQSLSFALYNRGLELALLAGTKSGEDAVKLYEQAIDNYRKALRLNPNFHEALNNWGNALVHLGETKADDKAGKLFDEAIQKFEAALKLKPDYRDALNNWGTTLCDLANTKVEEEANKLFNEAIQKFEAALKLKPDDYDALNNWGVALGNLAKAKAGDQADKLFDEAIQKFEAALKLKPDYHEALNNWGNALSYLAKTKSDDEADKLFNVAIQKYEAALKLKPNYHDALYNWGVTLSYLAKTKAGEEADNLFKEAIQKYEAALKFKPDYYDALNNWGVALSDLANMNSGEERESLLNEALRKCQTVETIRKGEGSYNIACIYALKGDTGQALAWLEAALKADSTLSKSHILKDADLDSIKSTSEFKELIDTYRPQ